VQAQKGQTPHPFGLSLSTPSLLCHCEERSDAAIQYYAYVQLSSGLLRSARNDGFPAINPRAG
jgi:hypothetical protein